MRFRWLGLLLLGGLAGCGELRTPAVAAPMQWMFFEWDGLYTHIRLTVEVPDSATGMRLRDSLDKRFVDFTRSVQTRSRLDSLVSHAPVGTVIPLDSDFCALFTYGEQKYNETHGRIHVGIGNLLRAYGLLHGMQPHLPTAEELAQEKQRLASLFYRMNSGCQMELLQTGTRYTLGSFAKGYAIDLGTAILDSAKLRNWYLEAGGDLATRGHNPHGKPWTLGLQDPDHADGLLATLSMSLQGRDAMATSGGYEQFFIDSAGVRHHHILDPLTLQSVDDKKSVTAVAASAMDADFWATYLFVLPFDSACKRVEEVEGLEAVLLSAHDSLYVSRGLRNRFMPLK